VRSRTVLPLLAAHFQSALDAHHPQLPIQE
jgi:hypothetical protein